MSQPTQKVLLLQHKQGPLVTSTIPKRAAAKGEVLIKVHASALNPVDYKIQDYGLFLKDEQYPAVLGLDVAGEIEEIGSDVQGFVKGDRVFFNGTFQNEYAGYQQYTRAPAELVAKIPSSLSYSQAASLPVGVVTAAVGLYAPAPFGAGLNPKVESGVSFEGESVLVIAASGSVGQYAVQLLKYLNFSTIIVYATTSQFDYLKSLGATELVDRKAVTFTDLPGAVKRIVSGGVKVVYDAFSSPDSQFAGYSSLASGGHLVVTLGDQVKPEDKKEGDGKTVTAVYGNSHPPHIREFAVNLFGKLPRLIEQGVIVPNKVEDLPSGLDGVVDGLRRLKEGSVSGVKLVARPQDTA